jgi:serine/threonine protein phosphatase PrpC
MDIIAITRKGLNKTENEDRIVVGKSILAGGTLFAEIDDGILAVADGVGGQNAGAVASHFVANKVCALTDITVEGMQAINNELLSLSTKNDEQKGMATTLSGILISDGKACLFSIGNTRVYILQSGKYLKQLTVDDTTLNYLLTAGQLTAEEAENFDRRNEITACFGGGTADLFKIKISKIDYLGAAVMITSDGIHDYITIDQMEDIIDKFGLTEKSCEEMIDVARKNGSFDDISIVLGCI